LENTLPIQRKLAQSQEQSSAALPDLLQTLQSLAETQASAGQIILADEHRQEANLIEELLEAERAVQDAEALAREDWVANATLLADCLNDFSVSLAEYGKRFWALQTVAWAAQIREELARQNPAVHEPELAGSLYNHAILLPALDAIPHLQRAQRLIAPYALPGTSYENVRQKIERALQQRQAQVAA
ncbi:MAG: hypothetical protein RL748_2079, partial [Pseudomonadota bacterium]